MNKSSSSPFSTIQNIGEDVYCCRSLCLLLSHFNFSLSCFLSPFLFLSFPFPLSVCLTLTLSLSFSLSLSLLNSFFLPLSLFLSRSISPSPSISPTASISQSASLPFFLFLFLILFLFHLISLLGGTSSPGISPAAFLHCLRANNILLTIEEEASLLDCLDVERLAESYGFIPMKNVDNNNHIYSSNKHSQNRDNLEYNVRTKEYSTYDLEDPDDFFDENNKNGISNRQNFGTNTFMKNKLKMQNESEGPLIHYNSFLSFCTRHCGTWIGTFQSLQFYYLKNILTIKYFIVDNFK